MPLFKSLKSFFRRCGRKILRIFEKLDRKGLIVALSVVTGLALTAAVIYVLRINAPHKEGSEDPGLEVSVEADGDSAGETSADEEISIETASAETKVESTEDTTILVHKENAAKGYMNRCVFLGDSRTVAMVNYGLINDDAALAQIGISHPSFANNNFINNAGKQYTLKSYLASHQAPVIYIALGVNGINDPSEEHYETTFTQLIDSIMEQAPNSNIVLMSIGPVDDNGAYKNTVQNSQIRKYNDFLLNTAKEKHIFYLDIAEVLTGDDGQVKSEYNGGDGLHYSGSGCQAIFDYIVSHPVPGIADDGEYVVKYVKPNPSNTKVTMDGGSGIDEEKLKEIMDMMMENATPTPTVTAVPTVDPAEEQRRLEEEQRAREEQEAREEREREKEKEEEEERQRREEEKEKENTPTPEPTQEPDPEPEPTEAPTPEPTQEPDPEPEPTEAPDPPPEESSGEEHSEE